MRETFSAGLELGVVSLRARHAEEETMSIAASVRQKDEGRLQEQIALVRGAADRAEIIRKIAPEPLQRSKRQDAGTRSSA